MSDAEKICVVCYGPMGKIPGDICCREEDQYLLVSAKGTLRETEDRAATIETLVAGLYDKLAEFLLKKSDSITNYEEPGVLAELERRVLRWIKLELLPLNAVKGISFCDQCGVPVMAGRSLCGQCGSAKSVNKFVAAGRPQEAPKIPRGMHTKHD